MQAAWQMAPPVDEAFSFDDLPPGELPANQPAWMRAPAVEENQQGNPVSRFLGDVVDQNVLPGGLGEGVLDVAAGTAQYIAEDPWKALVVDPAKSITGAPANAATAIGDTGRYLEAKARGDQPAADFYAEGAREYGSKALMGATEGALLFTPVKGAGAAAKPAATAEQQALSKFERAGVDPTIPAIAKTDTPARLAQPLSENLFAGATTREGAKRTLTQTEDAVERLASQYSNAGREQAGQAAIDGAQRFAAERGKYYERAFSRIDTEIPVPVSADFANKVRTSINRYSSDELNEIFVGGTAKKLRDFLSGRNSLTINDLRQLRSDAREAQKRAFMQDRDDAALSRLEGLLTQEMHQAIREEFGEAALHRLQRADTYYRASTERIKSALRPFLRDGISEESAYLKILSAAKTQGGNPKALRTLRRTLNGDEFDDIASGVLREMGKPQGRDTFNMETFVRQWESLSPAAKNILFNRRDEAVRQNLDALAFVAQRQARMERLANRSGSGVSIQNVTTGGLILAKPWLAVPAVLGGNAMGRAMMSPAFTRMMVDLQSEVPRIMRTGAGEAGARKRAYAIIAAAEASDESLKPLLEDLRRAVANDNPLPSSEAGTKEVRALRQ